MNKGLETAETARIAAQRRMATDKSRTKSSKEEYADALVLADLQKEEAHMHTCTHSSCTREYTQPAKFTEPIPMTTSISSFSFLRFSKHKKIYAYAPPIGAQDRHAVTYRGPACSQTPSKTCFAQQTT